MQSLSTYLELKEIHKTQKYGDGLQDFLKYL